MMPRRLRLPRAHFPSGRAGSRFSSEHFTLITGPSSAGGCAAVISKKIARRSVDRHLLKRRMLAAVRPYCREDRYIVLYARDGSLRLPYKTLAEELLRLLQSSLR